MGKREEQVITDTIRRALPDVEAIYLYGSMAHGAGRDDSDVDIACLRLQPLTASEVLALRTDLAVLLGRDVDLLDLRRASTEMAFQVVTDGRCLFGEEEEAVANFDTSIMSQYANLQIERREIVEDAVKRGSIYGR